MSQGVCSLSIAACCLHRAAPASSWSQGRLQTMGGEQETVAWETGFGSAAATTSHGPLAPFLSLLQKALPTAISHTAALKGWGCCRPCGLRHETLCTAGEERGWDTSQPGWGSIMAQEALNTRP